MIGIIFATIREARPFLQKCVMPHLMRHPDLEMDSRFRGNDNCIEIDSFPIFFNFPEKNIIVCVCGMGMENAANGTEQLIKSYKVDSIVNAGIAGALNSNFNIGHVVNVVKVVNSLSNGYYILDGADLWASLPSAVLITSPEPVFNGPLRSRLSTIADIVDMECAEIAHLCKNENIKFSAIKAISDLAGENDRSRLYENLDNLSVMVSEILWDKIIAVPAAKRRG